MATLSQLGFEAVTKRQCFLSPSTPLLVTIPPRAFEVLDRTGNERFDTRPGFEGQTTNRVIKADPEADVRARPPIGMFPASEFRYRAYVEIQPSGVDNTAFAAELSARATVLTRGFFPGPFTTLNLQRSTTVFAIVGFEGQDVFDMPESQFERTEEGIRVPDSFTGIYRVIHAGSTRLIPENDTTGKRFWATIGPFLERNLSIGTTKEHDSPFDVKAKFEEEGDPLFADTASRTIRVKGSTADIKFISFVGITNPIFRDVVVMRGSSKTESTGFFGNAALTRGREALVTEDRAQVLRFLWDESPEAKTPALARPRWSLSETFTIEPERTWNGSLQTVGLEDNPFLPSNYFVYNQLDKDFPSAQGLRPLTVLRRGFPPEFANQTVNIGGVSIFAPTLEQDFSREVIRFDENDFDVLVSNEQQFFVTGRPDLFSGSGLLCGTSVARTFNNHSFLFTSPKIKESVTGNFRLGHEYFASLRGGSLLEPSEFVLLVRTGPPGSVAASYDATTGDTDVLDATKSGEMKLREVNEARWTICRGIPESEFDGKFILGEFIFRTDGGSSIIRNGSRSLVSGTTISAPEGQVIVALDLQVREDIDGLERGTFKLFKEESDEVPAVEFTLFDASSPEGVMTVPVNPGTYERFELGGGIFGVIAIVLVKEDEVIQQKPTFPALQQDDIGQPWVAPSRIQFGQIPELSMSPEDERESVLEGRSVSVLNIPRNGFNVGCYENDGRVNLLTKGPADNEYSVIRDVTVRVQDVDSSSDDPTLPPANMPNLIFDSSSGLLLLFYLYKRGLFVKSFPVNLVTDSIERAPSLVETGGATPEQRITIESESRAIQRMHAALSKLVYDYSRVNGELAENDIRKKIVLVDPSQTISSEETVIVQAHTAFVDETGVIHLFIKEELRVIALKSADGGSTWQKTFTDDFFVHLADFSPKPGEEVTDKAQFPFILFDKASGACSLFFFADNLLLVNDFPSSLLRNTPENATKAYRETRAKLIFGTLTPDQNTDLISRGIARARNEEVEEDPDEPEDGTPQRIAAIVARRGHRRVFFKDSTDRLRSLTSSDISWRLDENFGQEILA